MSDRSIKSWIFSIAWISDRTRNRSSIIHRFARSLHARGRMADPAAAMVLASTTMIVLAAAAAGAVMMEDEPPLAAASVGRGCEVRAPQRRRAGTDVYGRLRIYPNDFIREAAMTVQQFDALLLEVGADIAAPRNPHRASRRRRAKLSVANRLLMVLLWLRSYHRYRTVAVWHARARPLID
jgi:hypothetical protein